MTYQYKTESSSTKSFGITSLVSLFTPNSCLSLLTFHFIAKKITSQQRLIPLFLNLFQLGFAQPISLTMCHSSTQIPS